MLAFRGALVRVGRTAGGRFSRRFGHHHVADIHRSEDALARPAGLAVRPAGPERTFYGGIGNVVVPEAGPNRPQSVRPVVT